MSHYLHHMTPPHTHTHTHTTTTTTTHTGRAGVGPCVVRGKAGRRSHPLPPHHHHYHHHQVSVSHCPCYDPHRQSWRWTECRQRNSWWRGHHHHHRCHCHHHHRHHHCCRHHHHGVSLCHVLHVIPPTGRAGVGLSAGRGTVGGRGRHPHHQHHHHCRHHHHHRVSLCHTVHVMTHRQSWSWTECRQRNSWWEKPWSWSWTSLRRRNLRTSRYMPQHPVF